MTRMIVNPRQVFDERGHAGQVPQGGLVTIRCGACQQGLGDPSGLLARQFGFTARRPLAPQRRAPALSPGAFPSVSNLAGHAQTARDLGGRIILTEELARFLAPLFHRGMVSCLRHKKTIRDNPLNVTLLYEPK